MASSLNVEITIICQNALVALMSDGIDYAATEAAMAAIQAENSHLFEFSQDTGLNYSPDDTLTASDIWR